MMKRTVRFFILITLLTTLVVGIGGVNAAPTSREVKELTILWAQWPPADYLQEIGNRYEQETGVKVNVIQEPWGSFYDRMSAEWAAKGDAYDMVVGDSQWLGQGAEQGHYMELTDFMKSNGIDQTVTAATLKYYGEFPANSGRYWGFPTEGDAVGWAYRKDRFEDPAEQEAFKAKYGYDLAVPTTWIQLRDIAEFFYRPDENIYGVGVYTQKDYDGMIMGYENVMFSWGVDWQNADSEVLGVVNSDKAVEALEFYKGLYQFAPPGTNNAFYTEMNSVFVNGQATMVMNYFAFLPDLLNAEKNPYAGSTGFFAGPAGPYGDRYVALGGQGMSVLNYISDERKQASLDFIKWFSGEDVQKQWAQVGGYTCNISVLESEEFLTNTPYNAAFADSMTFVKDFWNIPAYGELLESAQRYINGYVVGNVGTAKENLDNMAIEQHEALVEAGVLSE
jgi:multiple sugar transport system substrate-binding protein